MLKREIEFSLESEIEFHSGGDVEKSNVIYLYPPSMLNISKISMLKGIVFEAIKNASLVNGKSEAKIDDENSEELTPQAANDLVFMFNSESIEKYFLCFKSLFLDGCSKAGSSKQKMTDSILNKISVSDFEKMCGEYFVNFLMPSLLKKAGRG